MSYMLHLEASITFKKIYLPAKTWQNKKVQLSTQSSSPLPDSPPGCWECLACQVTTHAEQQPKSTLLLVEVKQAPYWKKLFSELLQLWKTLYPCCSALTLSPGTWQRPALSSVGRYLCNRHLCNPKERGPDALCQSILPLPFLTSSLPK